MAFHFADINYYIARDNVDIIYSSIILVIMKMSEK